MPTNFTKVITGFSSSVSPAFSPGNRASGIFKYYSNETVKRIPDPYIVDVLLPDLVGHDRKPSAFLVYLYLATASSRLGRARVPVSLQTIAVKTGLSKSAVQSAIRHLQGRQLLGKASSSTADPVREVLYPWRRAS
jgi:hypothetical protein